MSLFRLIEAGDIDEGQRRIERQIIEALIGVPRVSCRHQATTSVARAKQLIAETGHQGREIVALDSTDSVNSHMAATIIVEDMKKLA